MSVSFSGLASGIDTASIVESIIEAESAPITTMEDKQDYLQTKLDTYSEFNDLLETLSFSILGLNSQDDLASFDVTNNGSEYFSVSTTSVTTTGSYSVEVVSLAQRQKDVSSEGFADTEETTLSGELQIGDQTISYEDVTLSDLVSMIEDGEYGVSASIINDGTDSGYRLLLTADTAGEEISIVGTGDITIDTSTDGHTVEGSLAHAIIDGIDYYSSSNSITSAIHGATITLMQESDSGADNVTITADTENTIATQLQEIIDGYNAINEFIDTLYDSDPTLANSMKSVQRGLKTYLTSSGLVNLGVSTDYDTGELSLDTDMLADAYEADPDGVIATLLGDDDSTGIMTRLDEYMSDQVDSSSGFYATKEETINDQIDRLDETIEAMQTRLDKRQEMLEAQFTAMETLISSLNSQADYLDNFFSDYSSS
jgi:flagellar hook-associated protein 2